MTAQPLRPALTPHPGGRWLKFVCAESVPWCRCGSCVSRTPLPELPALSQLLALPLHEGWAPVRASGLAGLREAEEVPPCQPVGCAPTRSLRWSVPGAMPPTNTPSPSSRVPGVQSTYGCKWTICRACSHPTPSAPYSVLSRWCSNVRIGAACPARTNTIGSLGG